MCTKRGFTLLEILIVIAIMAIISGMVISTFTLFNKSQALSEDVGAVTEVLQQARSQTLSSMNASQYGVHFASTTVTLFTGSAYSSSNSSNVIYNLNTTDTAMTVSLAGGGYDVIFNRLSGETSDNGTVIFSSPSTGATKTVTIYKTGLVESN